MTFPANEKEKEAEMMKKEVESVVGAWEERNRRVEEERDLFRAKVEEYERTFSDRQQRMCEDLQQKLTSKYQELVSEFGGGTLQSLRGAVATGTSSQFTQVPSPRDQVFMKKVEHYYQAHPALFNPSAARWPQATATAAEPMSPPIDISSASLAEEFLKQLQRAEPIGTPRREITAPTGTCFSEG